MFETAELGKKIDKAAFEKRVPALRTALLGLQERLKAAKFPVVILVNGVDGAGKGDVVNVLHEWLDPRFIAAHAFGPATDEERLHPRWWRFWRVMPPKGRIGIFFGSWYTDPIVERVHKHTDKEAFAVELARIQAMERQWVEDGALLLKLWFHISKDVQKERFDELRKKKSTRWRVTNVDLQNHKMYDRFLGVSERALYETSTGHAPWTIIEGTDARFAKLSAGEALAKALRTRLELPVPAAPKRSASVADGGGGTIFDTLDMKAKVDDETYDARLPKLQGELNAAVRQMRKRGRSLVVVLEGWDAAGKGGAIRRMTQAMDARDYNIVPVAAPTEEERAQHYLWRFWRHMPSHGRVSIFDRSWYGRVLVERVEGFARDDEWQRAYNEIAEMEEQLADARCHVVKLWLHIGPDEQMKRFKEREKTKWKQFKIGDEDWRNRKRWDDYIVAAHEMVEKTSTQHAPWHLVAANDKRHARLEILTHLVERMG